MGKLILKVWPIVFVLLLLVILVGYLVVISYPENFKVDMSPLLSNVVNFGLSAFLTFYISKIGFQRDNEKSQKKIAKVSIRGIRNNSRQLGYLIMKCDNLLVKNMPISVEMLENIREQMENVLRQIINSEEDFKDLVNEEYQKEFDIMGQIIEARKKIQDELDQYKLLEQQLNEYKKLLVDKDEESKMRMNELTKQLDEKAKEIRLLRANETLITNTLPLGIPYTDSDSMYRINPSKLNTNLSNALLNIADVFGEYQTNKKNKNNK